MSLQTDSVSCKRLPLVPGLLLTAGIAIPAWLLGKAIPIAGSPVFGLFLGMLVAAWKRPRQFSAGIQFSSKTILKAAIILLGFNMNLTLIMQTGKATLLLMATTISISLLTGALLGRVLKVERKSRTLVTIGTCICGGSAIAACAPIISASDEEIAASISTIFLFNVLAAFLFPALGHLMGMSNYQFGIWAGTAINDTSSVVAAAYAFSDQAGALAVIVKLTRTLVIIPISLILAFMEPRYAAKAAAAKAGSVASDSMPIAKPSIQFGKIFPWFILGFLAAAAAYTLLPLPGPLTKLLSSTGKFFIVIAMVAIGLNTQLLKLLRNGWRPILLGLGNWLVLSVAALAAQKVFL